MRYLAPFVSALSLLSMMPPTESIGATKAEQRQYVSCLVEKGHEVMSELGLTAEKSYIEALRLCRRLEFAAPEEEFGDGVIREIEQSARGITPSGNKVDWPQRLSAAKSKMAECLKNTPPPRTNVERSVEIEIHHFVELCGGSYLKALQDSGLTDEQSMASASFDAYKMFGCKYSHPTDEDLYGKPDGMREVHCSSNSEELSVPAYDVEAGCRRQAGLLDGVFNQCVASEQSDYDNIKFVWPRLSARGKARVYDVFESIKKDQKIPVRAYSVLSSVVIDELERDRIENINKTQQKFVP